MTAGDIPVADLPALLRDDTISTAVKDRVINTHAPSLTTEQPQALRAVADYCQNRGLIVSTALLAVMASAHLPTELVLALLVKHPTTLTADQLTPVLTALGSNYRKLTSRNGKHPRIDDSPAAQALVDRLEQLDLARSRTTALGTITVHMRQPIN